MIKLYTNENFPFPSVQALKKLGYDMLTTQDAGLAGKAISDIDVLKYAIKQKRILITLNRKHFIYLHSKIPEHHGISSYFSDWIRFFKSSFDHPSKISIFNAGIR